MIWLGGHSYEQEAADTRESYRLAASAVQFGVESDGRAMGLS